MIGPTPSDQALRKLVLTRDSPCLSIYVSGSENRADRDQLRIRLKNQLARAERGVRDWQDGSTDADALLAPVQALLTSDLPAAARSGGIALYRSPSTCEFLQLPESVGALMFIGDEYFVKPLLPLVNLNQQYRLLALSQNDVRLFEGDRYSLKPLQVPHLPQNLQDALRDDDNDNQTLQFHTGTATVGGGRPAIFHGQAVGQEHSKERIMRFCQLVDRAVTDCFGDQEVPLLLAATEPLPGIYRQANSYRALHSDVIRGDPRQLSEVELRERAWDVVAQQAARVRDEALALLNEALAKNHGTTDLSEALAAAREGRVATLFVRSGASQAGPDSSRDAEPVAASTAAQDDDVNRVVVETLRHGGRAFAVRHDRMPQGGSVGALYRY